MSVKWRFKDLSDPYHLIDIPAVFISRGIKMLRFFLGAYAVFKIGEVTLAIARTKVIVGDAS